MDFKLSKEQEQLRFKVRAFLEEQVNEGVFVPKEDAWMHGLSKEFSKQLGIHGWIGMPIPKEYGGAGRGYLERLIVTEELLRYGAPQRYHWTADRQIAPAIVKYGSKEQKIELLPKIIRGEMNVALAFSEPDAGSDLASLKTTAFEKDGEFIINGQKVWSSGAGNADYLYMLVRTDTKAPKKHQGLSQFLVPTNLSGITIKPLTDIAGHQHFCEIFLDNVIVPKTVMIGVKNSGWAQVSESLVYERAGMERLMSNYPLFVNLTKYVKEKTCDNKKLSEIPWIRDKIVELNMRFETAYLLVYRSAWLLDKIKETGYIPNWETSMTKAFCVEFVKDLANCATNIAGLYGGLSGDSKYSPYNGMGARSYLFSPGYSLQGGGSEVLKGIVAMRGLGLPRGN